MIILGKGARNVAVGWSRELGSWMWRGEHIVTMMMMVLVVVVVRVVVVRVVVVVIVVKVVMVRTLYHVHT